MANFRVKMAALKISSLMRNKEELTLTSPDIRLKTK